MSDARGGTPRPDDPALPGDASRAGGPPVPGEPPRLELAAGSARLVVDLAEGGRLASLAVEGSEILVTSGMGTIAWGSYPMAPFAGRIGGARLAFEGRVHELRARLPPHALHGTVLDRPWRLLERGEATAVLAADLGPGWPFPGTVTQRLALAPDGLRCELALEATAPMPAWIGWHPWFRRVLDGPLGDGGGGAPVEIGLDAAAMYRRGADALPTGERVAPPPPPWDDCFTGVRWPVRLRWPGALELAVAADVPCVVVYDEQPHAVAVEPQTAPPDAARLGEAALVVPGRPLAATMTWRWRRLAGG